MESDVLSSSSSFSLFILLFFSFHPCFLSFLRHSPPFSPISLFHLCPRPPLLSLRFFSLCCFSQFSFSLPRIFSCLSPSLVVVLMLPPLSSSGPSPPSSCLSGGGNYQKKFGNATLACQTLVVNTPHLNLRFNCDMASQPTPKIRQNSGQTKFIGCSVCPHIKQQQ